APETPLKEVTRIMNQHMLESVSVTDADGTLLGQITCDQLFKLGMPDFFTQLKSVSFIREFDPFEKYFQKETGALARDVMTADMATLPEEATLLEVVFELAVRRHPKIYVVRAGKRVGVIDRSLVLDRVINI
ncbi:MAG TPA: CBS domain-containing protein, partial [Candidatus Hydrogenedentes bacterium]|nr:CBS domain-containing protein [Candidatus Hydrogenedentota bacterium]